ncbi:MAG: helix-turn-helix transcriptional regulator [Angelakisella sp.]|jgi:transcriptional regulator with XRE-family HTH domain|nr:helix-turn-helix transcriptional regulator [Angelakisella sp.]
MRKRNIAGKKPDFKPIGRAMREARLCEGWTQEEAAEKLGIEQPYYQRLETTGQYPSVELLYKIVRLFQLSVDEFFFPNVTPVKSGRRKRLDSMLDRLNDNELLVVESTIKGLLRMKEDPDK